MSEEEGEQLHEPWSSLFSFLNLNIDYDDEEEVSIISWGSSESSLQVSFTNC